MQNFKFVQIGFVDSDEHVKWCKKNYPELKSYPMVFNNPLLICLIISPLDRIGSCVWENWKKEKKLWLTSKSTQQCLLMTLLTLLFLLENNFTVMTRISVRFVTYQSDHYTEQIVERRKYYFPSISYYFHIPKNFLIFFPHTGKNRNRRKSNLLP